MEATTRSKVIRDKPSTKARSKAYVPMRKLFDILETLEVCDHPYDDIDDEAEVVGISPDYKGWKDWANKHIPPDKRGGSAKS